MNKNNKKQDKEMNKKKKKNNQQNGFTQRLGYCGLVLFRWTKTINEDLMKWKHIGNIRKNLMDGCVSTE